jgi:hypothetical protein
MTLPRQLLVAALAVLVGGCAADRPKTSSDLNHQRQILNGGYSMLQRDMSHAGLAGLILVVKTETESVEQTVKAISEFGKRVTHELDRLAKEHPDMRVDLEPLPEMEIRKRFAIGEDRAIDFLPIVGVSQQEFERTMLISLSNALNHERHLCQVMAEEEPEPALKKFLLDTGTEFDALYDRTMALLKRDYFKDSGGKPKN